jgi:predicted flap endonuclease-1-like 5' DNA nuclease
MEQPQTAPVETPEASGFEAAWPEPEVSLSQAETAPIEELAKAEGEAAPEIDDLRLIEGIGPKISSVLQSAGIRTFQQLADTEPSRVEEILQESGLRLADPSTWPEQARLLADGDLDGLRRLQGNLKAGRRS